jgi:hypothetical protein
MKQFDFSTRARRKEAWLFLEVIIWGGLGYRRMSGSKAKVASLAPKEPAK